MYQPPTCDRCGLPIDWDEERNDTGPEYRFQMLRVDAQMPPEGYDLHKACSREVKRDYDAIIRRAAMNPIPTKMTIPRGVS